MKKKNHAKPLSTLKASPRIFFYFLSLSIFTLLKKRLINARCLWLLPLPDRCHSHLSGWVVRKLGTVKGLLWWRQVSCSPVTLDSATLNEISRIVLLCVSPKGVNHRISTLLKSYISLLYFFSPLFVTLTFTSWPECEAPALAVCFLFFAHYQWRFGRWSGIIQHIMKLRVWSRLSSAEWAIFQGRGEEQGAAGELKTGPPGQNLTSWESGTENRSPSCLLSITKWEMKAQLAVTRLSLMERHRWTRY